MTTKLQSLLAFWQEMSLPAFQRQLDDVATEITARQDESEAGKVALIDMMRDFKRQQPEDVRTAVAPMIKAFQNEVDSLARRGKAAEKAFFETYKRLTDMTDPVPALEQALEAQKSLGKVADMEIEIKQLRETLGDYNKEIQEHKSKEKKLNELKAKVEAYDKNIDETLQEKIKDVTSGMLEEYNEKVANIEEEKEALKKRAAEAEAKAEQAQKKQREAKEELYEAQRGIEENRTARAEEIDMLAEDLEKANHRASAAEREAELAKELLEEAKREARERNRDDRREERDEETREVERLQRDLAAKEREVERHLSENKVLRAERETESKTAQDELAALRQERDEGDRMVESLEAKLNAQADYEAVKKDLAVMRSLEFPSEDEAGKKPLEVLILERSKVLQSENTSLRVERDRATEELGRCKKELSDKHGELERQSRLVTELEDHVEQLQELSKRGEAEGRSSADILTDALDFSTQSSPAREAASIERASPEVEGSASKVALLPIVQAQRERFKRRNEELETEQAKQMEQMGVLQAEVKDLRDDKYGVVLAYET